MSDGAKDNRSQAKEDRRDQAAAKLPPMGLLRRQARDEAAAFMAEILASLVRMARAQRLAVLTYLLSRAQLEAEEHGWLRSRRKLS